MFKLPRHAEIWGLPYLKDRVKSLVSKPSPKRVFVSICDHFEPYYGRVSEERARTRVALWREKWPIVAARSVCDSDGRPPQYSFFYPEEEYRPRYMEALAEMVRANIADVEIHLHHDREGRQDFIDRMSKFRDTLHNRHGLLRKKDGRLIFGFIHGNWALDNSLPGGALCGLNDEITILRELGCYADFTMPSGSSESQARTVNSIYWCTDDPYAPKSYDQGIPVTPGGGVKGDLLMITGPIGLRWRDRLLPRLEGGEITSQDPATRYRVKRWFDLAPQVGADLFIKLHTHGAQERHSGYMLSDGLKEIFERIADEAKSRGCSFHWVTAWEMFCRIEHIYCRTSEQWNRGVSPVRTTAAV